MGNAGLDEEQAEIKTARRNINDLRWHHHYGRKQRRTKDQIVKIHSIIENAREFQKNIYFCFMDGAKAFDCGSQQTVENS